MQFKSTSSLKISDLTNNIQLLKQDNLKLNEMV